MGKIILTTQACSYSEYGNIADFRLMLNGGSCTVNWGDGTTTTHDAEGEEQHIRHTYPEECIKTGKTFVITISSDEDNIVGISAISEQNHSIWMSRTSTSANASLYGILHYCQHQRSILTSEQIRE